MARITLAGESLIAQKQGAKQALVVSKFIFANVPGLDPNTPIDRAAGKPPANQIVYTYVIPAENSGYVNPNQVVYSAQLGSDIGDFDWNWMGLETAEGVLFAVAYMPLQQKRKNIPPLQLGNNVTRNVLVEYDGAQETTGISIDAKTWQHDFTVRLAGIDERERLSNRDMFGRACFFDTGLQVEKVGTAYQIKPGLAYVEGVRVNVPAGLAVPAAALPTTVWLDVVLERQLNDVVARWSLVCAAAKPDYKDALGVQHYCIPLADLTAAVISDRRPVEAITGPVVKHFAAKIGTYPQLRAQATTKGDVGLDQIPNAISNDPANNSTAVLATTNMVQAVRNLLQAAINNIISGVSIVGKAARLATARTISLTGGATGSGVFDGAADLAIPVVVDPTKHGHTIAQTAGLQAALDGKFSTAGGTLTGNVVISTDWWSSIALQGGYGDRVMLHAGGLEGGNELRIGRYSRLDGSWISNPFVFKMETGELYATRLIGNGSGLVELNANYLGEGTVPIARLVGTYNINVNGTAAAATKLAAQRTLSASGDASWAVAFDGTSNVSATITLANSGVAAGSYPKVTVNAKGLVTGGAALVAADIPALDTSKLTTGILPIARGGTGNGAGQAPTALKLATPRTISISGAGSGAANFDGSANITIPLTVDASKVQAGILPLSRGGLGANTPAGARSTIGAGVPATASLSTSGWWRDEDTGFIEQWIQASGADNTEVVVNLPIAFPNQALNVQATPVGPSSAPGTTGSLSVSASFINNSQVRLGLNWSGGSPSSLVFIRAIGR
ncbi:phage tail protein [Pseudomonas sp. p1(2021b)]|uniref:phage tail-collar fiber domain-containing protein n=1 Tax=Pseudomonas sp. p1(2021b) TaxID=2874628 RepID=UPI001CCC8CC9|nr:phage tail protein [Pseudomonas sp. p1(2021b)]UBM24196.1 phage tail protein [Pseudomonas sp. p1(2021b)]